MMKIKLVARLLATLALTISLVGVSAAYTPSATFETTSDAEPLIDATQASPHGNTYAELYDEIMGSLMGGCAVQRIDGDLWVPWYATSSSCETQDLQRGGACDLETIDETHNCMVTDEFSQVGVLLAMGTDAQEMRSYTDTLETISSTNGALPAWRVHREGDQIKVCDPKTNGNCDSASDADARAIMSLWMASTNDAFPAEDRERYANLATRMAADFVEYDLVKDTRQTSRGEITYWLAAGAEAARGGFSSWDFTYTGYYPDAIIAMLQSCAQTGDEQYCTVADDLAENYLLAAQYDGNGFTAPPGRSYKWTGTGTDMRAECTNTCEPVMWDGHDAPRALGICQAQYYAEAMGRDVGLASYCADWEQTHLSDPAAAPLQYTPDGSVASSSQSGYFAQGLQALARTQTGSSEFKATLDNALEHYTPTTGTWDWAAGHGVYTQAMPIRALGAGMGRTLEALGPAPTINDTNSTDDGTSGENVTDGSTDPATETYVAESIAELPLSYEGVGFAVLEDVTAGVCRTVEFTTDGGYGRVFSCEKGDDYVEVYKQEGPSGSWELCLNDGCLGSATGGFATTTMTVETTNTTSDDSTNSTDDSGSSDETVDDPVTETYVAESIAELPLSYEGAGFSVQSDVTAGVCRTVEFTTDGGYGRVMGCMKDDNYVEVYKQEGPSGSWELCLNTGCLGSATGGFATTTMTVETTNTTSDDSTNSTDDSGSSDETVDDPVTETYVAESIAELPLSHEGVGFAVLEDVTDGVCRTVEFETAGGYGRVFSCEKGDDYVELYKQASPSDSWRLCLNSGCLGSTTGGFAKTTMTVTG